MDGEIHNHDYFPSTTATSTALGATSIHITALDGIINVNSLFTLAIFIGISYNPSDPTSITSSSCFPSIHVAESMVSFHVYSFSSFLLSSLIALCLKQGIRILPHPPHGTRAAKVNKRLLRVGILGSAVGSVCGCGFLMMALVCLVQVKLGKFECGGATVGAVIPLVTLIPAAMLVYVGGVVTKNGHCFTFYPPSFDLQSIAVHFANSDAICLAISTNKQRKAVDGVHSLLEFFSCIIGAILDSISMGDPNHGYLYHTSL